MSGPDPRTKCRFSRGIHSLIILAAFVKNKPRRRPVTEARVNEFRMAFVSNSHKSTRLTALQLNLAYLAVNKFFSESFKFKRYMYILLTGTCYCVAEQDKGFLRLLSLKTWKLWSFTVETVFSDEATFHFSGNVNQHNQRIWGDDNPQEIMWHTKERQSKVERVLYFVQREVFVHVSLPEYCD